MNIALYIGARIQPLVTSRQNYKFKIYISDGTYVNTTFHKIIFYGISNYIDFDSKMRVSNQIFKLVNQERIAGTLQTKE